MRREREEEEEGEEGRENSTRVERRKMYEERKGCRGKRRRGKGEEDSGWREQRSTPATLAATVAST